MVIDHKWMVPSADSCRHDVMFFMFFLLSSFDTVGTSQQIVVSICITTTYDIVLLNADSSLSTSLFQRVVQGVRSEHFFVEIRLRPRGS